MEGEQVKLFVRHFPKEMTHSQLKDVFREYAVIDGVQINQDKSTLESIGNGFLICPNIEEAEKAISILHNKNIFPNERKPLEVMYANGELVRLAQRGRERSAQIAQEHRAALSAGSHLGYSGGMLPDQLFQISPLNQGLFLSTSSQPGTSGMVPLGSPYSPQPSSRFRSSSSSQVMPPRTYAMVPSPSGGIMSSTRQIRSPTPTGAVVFVANLPPEFRDRELESIFYRYGKIFHYKVFINEATGESRCFGIVRYESVVAAQLAINVMNGFHFGRYKLQVGLLRDY